MEQVKLGEVVSIDNFLDNSEWIQIKNLILYNPDFPLYFQQSVTGLEDNCFKDGFWNYALKHVFYRNNKPLSKHFETIYDIFWPKFKLILDCKTLIRAKLNMFPYTPELKEYDQHVDLKYQHFGAVFYLNTCDGFTRIGENTKVDSIENRMLFFDPSVPHNSTSTTNTPVRYNINFNLL